MWFSWKETDSLREQRGTPPDSWCVTTPCPLALELKHVKCFRRTAPREPELASTEHEVEKWVLLCVSVAWARNLVWYLELLPCHRKTCFFYPNGCFVARRLYSHRFRPGWAQVTFGSLSETSTEIRKYSKALYASLEEETGQATGFSSCGCDCAALQPCLCSLLP